MKEGCKSSDITDVDTVLFCLDEFEARAWIGIVMNQRGFQMR